MIAHRGGIKRRAERTRRRWGYLRKAGILLLQTAAISGIMYFVCRICAILSEVIN